jgi:hypothetical protein
MRNKLLLAIIAAISALFINGKTVHAQTPDTDNKKFEVGAQFSVLQSSQPGRATFTGIQCITTPCPSFAIGSSRELQPGFGGRFGYNLTKNLAVEAEVNFFPDAGSFSEPDAFKGGHKIEGLFGVKAGKRFDKVGIFAKARPGFLHASKGDIQPRRGGVCALAITIFPPPVGCFETISKSNFAFDLGGVVEVYPTKRTIIRFDAGDTIVRSGERNVPAVFNPSPGILAPSFVTIVRAPAKTVHNFQGSIGIGLRF